LAVLVLGSLVRLDPSTGTRAGAGQGCAPTIRARAGSNLQAASCNTAVFRAFVLRGSERGRTVVAFAAGVSACRRLARPGDKRSLLIHPPDQHQKDAAASHAWNMAAMLATFHRPLNRKRRVCRREKCVEECSCLRVCALCAPVAPCLTRTREKKEANM
jgi:hypothetical protein